VTNTENNCIRLQGARGLLLRDRDGKGRERGNEGRERIKSCCLPLKLRLTGYSYLGSSQWAAKI